MSTQIESISIKRFKQLAELQLDLNDTTVLIGANNAGKSSALQALHFAVSVAQTAKLVGEGVNWATGKFQVSFNPTQLLYSPVADVLSLAHGEQLQEPLESQIEIRVTCTDGTNCVVSVRRGRNRNIAVVVEGRKLGERLMDLTNPFTIYAPGLAGIAKEERYQSPGVVRRIVARGDANLVLRNVLLMLKDAESEEVRNRAELQAQGKLKTEEVRTWKGSWQRFQEGMRRLFDDIEFEVKFDRDRDEHIEVFFTRPGKPRLPIDAAGTSILQASQILAYITLFRPSVLILDEPDSHLHPNNQRALCNLILELAVEHAFRPLISTHSRHVLDAMRDRATVIWVSNGRKVDFNSVTTASLLMEIGALDSVDYFTGGSIRCLFATEDNDSDSIKALHSLLSVNGFRLPETDIRAYSGCTKIDSAKVLRGFLADKAPHVQFVLHRDRDYMADDSAQNFNSDIKSIGAFPFLTEHSDVEGYFINAEHLAHLNTGLTVARAQELIDEATDKTKDKSLKILTNIRFEVAQRERPLGKAPDVFSITDAARKDYEADSAKWRRGKFVLKLLKQLIHQELGRTANIIAPSPYVLIQDLQQTSAAIWPAPSASGAKSSAQLVLPPSNDAAEP
jgi:AAA ATPase domain/AAA domain, putative AbiEii toxin, Type IV TA system